MSHGPQVSSSEPELVGTKIPSFRGSGLTAETDSSSSGQHVQVNDSSIRWSSRGSQERLATQPKHGGAASPNFDGPVLVRLGH